MVSSKTFQGLSPRAQAVRHFRKFRVSPLLTRIQVPAPLFLKAFLLNNCPSGSPGDWFQDSLNLFPPKETKIFRCLSTPYRTMPYLHITQACPLDYFKFSPGFSQYPTHTAQITVPDPHSTNHSTQYTQHKSQYPTHTAQML